ncbi:uncharacterized protein LOC122381925 [Amphibalanus amphitrite]|uniref:uncharacterized protein LOC122381925 n=1 Tax=Amphibalanus amphitrite TaxID=1232801 RepID=UPI001C8FB822|nr:uncharacterized protein LOC122381925 [Amphibalanus amphitrite]XP_043222649.1 uncharacterized protein LOC122381925 [Amphibalanus amphitrite]
MTTGSGYLEARRLLDRRYGDEDSITSAFVDMLVEWPQVKPGDLEGMDRLSLTLRSCNNVMSGISPGARETDHPKTMRKIIEKLPYNLQDQWRRLADHIHEQEHRRARFEDIVDFVEREVRIQTNPMFGRQHSVSRTREQEGQRRKVQTVSATVIEPGAQQRRGSLKCLFCSKAHYLDQCEEFRGRAPHEKSAFVREQGLCFGCLCKGHLVRECAKRRTCSICRLRHPTALHNDRPPPEHGVRIVSDGHAGSEVPQNPSQVVTNGRVKLRSSSKTCADSSSTMMSIVPVKMWTDGGQKVETYAFLDGGSSATFCSESLLKQIGAVGENVKLSMTTASVDNQQVDSRVIKGVKISDLGGSTCIAMPPMYTLSTIPVKLEDMASSEDLNQWVHLQGIDLARIDAEIGLLIGSNCPQALQPLEVRRSEDGGPFALRTELGWVVQGPRRVCQNENDRVRVNRIRVVNESSDLHRSFMALYNQDFEDHGSSVDVGLSREDQQWLKKVETGVRFINGHYELPVPLRDEQVFPNNRQQAEQRAQGLKKRMLRDEKYLRDYSRFVSELIEKDYAEKVSRESLDACWGRTWYIPHHGVYHPAKPDKIRVVYDCSASYRGVSLNDRLLQGPNLTSSLIGVLLRFRQEPFAIMGDVEKMFYQVRVADRDRSLLRFLWWPDGDVSRQLEDYQMNVHLFGATSSPSCANFALRRTAQDYGGLYQPEVARCIQRNFYVDDFLKSASTEDEAAGLALEVRECCARGGFRLTGFVSNSSRVMSCLPETDRAPSHKMDLTKGVLSPQRALGVQWDVDHDTLSFRVEVQRGPASRRGILSTVSAMYDPLGFGAPFLLPAKVLLQDLCRLQLGWDDPIPYSHLQRWNQWCEELADLRDFSVPRSVAPLHGEARSRQLHMFADASEVGYGAVGYVRVEDAEGRITTSLLMSKCRVAPLKTCSIPRLELTAAALAVQLSTQILSETDLHFDEVCFWTDSVSTLRYIQNVTSRFQTFVANKLAVIHDGSSPNQWRYVPSELNPADSLSRGQSGPAFLASRWVLGPAFLESAACEWPDQSQVQQLQGSTEELEIKKSVVSATTATEGDDYTAQLLNSTSDWFKLKKRVAWVLRWKQLLQKRVAGRKESGTRDEDLLSPRLSVQELEMAEAAILRHVQEQAFPEEMSGSVRKSSRLFRLNPCVVDGTLRVGGRLVNAQIPDAAKHQLILPKNGHVTDLIIRDMHERKGHSGREYVLAELRRRFWIVSGSSAVRRVLSRCVRCRKIQGSVVTQQMSNLPEDRTAPDSGVFSRVGTDYFGPFYVKVGRKQMKRYCVLFTCLATRAIHIEVCETLDTSSFINALRRFQARRGQVKFIRSDNGTNFTGAERELREEVRKLREKSVHDCLLKEGITWKFTPPGASSQGGIWERQVRSIRKVLNALLREQTMTDESLRTLLCEVEAVLNSRPLTTVSSDPADLQPLTPNDLLLLRGGPVPDGIFSERDSCFGRRWKQVQYLADLFWKRWVKEYLPLLQQRQKWVRTRKNLSVGDVVLVVDVNSPRCRWPLGRVLEVFPDGEGLVRSAMVKTASSVLKRPISKLVFLM